MKKPSIIGRFLQIQQDHPELSDYVCFGRAVMGQDLTEKAIYRLMSRLVPKDDHPDTERTEHMTHFVTLSKTPSMEGIKRG